MNYPLRLLSALFLAMILISSAWAQSDPPQDNPGRSPDANGESYWGPIPPAESKAVALEDNKMPAWEMALMVPYTVISIPFKILAISTGGAIVFAEKNRGFFETVAGAKHIGQFTLNLTGAAGGLAGIGGGIAVKHSPTDDSPGRFQIRGSVSSNENRRTSVGFRFPIAENDALQFGGGYRLRRNARFFGLGPNTPEHDESRHTRETTWGGINYSHGVPANFWVEGGVMVSAVGTRSPREEEDPALEDQFAGNLPFGYRERSDGISYGVTLGHDDTRGRGRPEAGGLRRIKVNYFDSFHGPEIRFWTYRGELQQFFPLWHSKRALAARALVSYIDERDDDSVPFQRLLSNDEPDQFRGFRDFRFHDKGLLAFSLEYRWPVWATRTVDGPGLDAYLFTDIGQVFDDSNEITIDNTAFSYGVGIRAAAYRNFFGRIELGVSHEEVVFRLRADQVFQYAKGGLYDGKDPVPAR